MLKYDVPNVGCSYRVLGSGITSVHVWHNECWALHNECSAVAYQVFGYGVPYVVCVTPIIGVWRE